MENEYITQLKEMQRLVLLGLQSLNPFVKDGINVEEDDFKGDGLEGYLYFDGIQVYPKCIDIVRNSIFGKKTLTVNGWVLAKDVITYSHNRDVQDDHDIVPISEHEHVHQAAYAAVMLWAGDRLNAAFETDGMAQGFKEEKEMTSCD